MDKPARAHPLSAVVAHWICTLSSLDQPPRGALAVDRPQVRAPIMDLPPGCVAALDMPPRDSAALDPLPGGRPS